MSENSKLPAPATISSWLQDATTQLERANIASARLDAELILCHMLGVERTWLIAHSDESLTRAALSQKGGTRREGLKEYGHRLILKRLKRHPMAYLIGVKEFYGREFTVTPDVLVPRPETEAMIELLAEPAKAASTLVDVGTGSGVIAVTAKLEHPHLKVVAVDVSQEALKIAKKNAKLLGASVTFREDNLLGASSGYYDVICANLPYVDRRWDVSPEVKAEPDLALYAEDNGLALIYELLPQAAAAQQTGGHLLLEADPRQHAALIAQSETCGYDHLRTEGFIVSLRKK